MYLSSTTLQLTGGDRHGWTGEVSNESDIFTTNTGEDAGTRYIYMNLLKTVKDAFFKENNLIW